MLVEVRRWPKCSCRVLEVYRPMVAVKVSYHCIFKLQCTVLWKMFYYSCLHQKIMFCLPLVVVSCNCTDFIFHSSKTNDICEDRLTFYTVIVMDSQYTNIIPLTWLLGPLIIEPAGGRKEGSKGSVKDDERSLTELDTSLQDCVACSLTCNVGPFTRVPLTDLSSVTYHIILMTSLFQGWNWSS